MGLRRRLRPYFAAATLREGAAPVRVTFVLSLPRSGSNWLALVLGSHPWAANLGEFSHVFSNRHRRIYCPRCRAEGLDDCAVLHGLHGAPEAAAFQLAAERLGDVMLVDASKLLDWCAAFARRPDIDVRVIHLVRHPCGFVESQGRRAPDMTPLALMRRWEAFNGRISRFIARHRLPSRLACYDDLADRPQDHFPALCAFLGQEWAPQSLEYWRFPQHGVAFTGATSLLLRGRPGVAIKTGDDAYYAELDQRPVAADVRWRERLPLQLQRELVTRPAALELARRLGRDGWEV